jgi:hypothetical protein
MEGNFKGVGRMLEGICYHAGTAWEDCSRNCIILPHKGDAVVLFALCGAIAKLEIV